MPNKEDLLSVSQVAALLKITRRAVVHRIHAGTLNAQKLGQGTAQYVITRGEVDRVLAERAESEVSA
jgi:excisionase family DNA binding protein